MVRKIGLFLLAFAGVYASTVLASAQATSSPTDSVRANSSPVAYVYVSSYASSAGTFQVYGYAAAANGALTPIPGSPFADSVSNMAVNGAWLFGAEQTSSGETGNVNSYSIASNGALTLKQQTQLNDSGGGAIYLYLDHTGSSLYTDYYTANNDFLTYTIDQSTGALSYVSTLPGGPSDNSPVSFIGNNIYAYSSSCYHFNPGIIGVQRATNGSLSYLNNFNPAFPAIPSGYFWCPWRAAADPTNHLAIAMQPLNSNWTPVGAYRLASYTADNSGNLTTTNTYKNMPPTGVGNVTDYWMSPSGKLLAVGGSTGLQVFHFNGTNPITRYTGLLTTNYVDQVFWDNANHLYAITPAGLYVFTVTPTSVSQAPGSPYSIPGGQPLNLVVLPKT